MPPKSTPSARSLRTSDEREVLFVAQPDLAPPDAIQHYARPDDVSDDGRTWRERLVAYNAVADNPLNLLPAYKLTRPMPMALLADRFGLGRLFILSAGWGLIAADFLTPVYDITFTTAADDWKRRRKGDRYQDFCMLSDDNDPIVFVGGKDYLPLFSNLTARLQAPKIVFFNSGKAPTLAEGFEVVRYPTTTRTNWHYECARDLAAGNLDLPLR